MLDQPAPVATIWLAVLVPLVQGILVEYPNTKLIRLALVPVGLYCGFIAAFSRTEWIPLVQRLRLGQIFLIWDTASSIKFALADKPPHLASPSNDYLVWLRSFPPIKSAILLASDSTVNLKPNTAPPHRFTWRMYFQGIWYHLSRFLFSFWIADLASYPLWRVAPQSFGSPDMQPRDFQAWCASLGAQYGVPSWCVWVFWTWTAIITTGSATAAFPHLCGLVCVITGFASPKEFPMVMHGPLLSCSFNDFWGTRYHQLIRPCLTYLASPFKNGPKSLYIMAVFVASGFYHVACYYPLTFPTDLWADFWPYAVFYIGHGLGCVLERQYYKRTGQKMGGLKGWLLFWGSMTVLAMPTAQREYGTGWMGRLRGEMAKPQDSLLCWLAYALGHGADPRTYA